MTDQLTPPILPEKPPVYKRWWFIVVAVLVAGPVLLSVCISIAGEQVQVGSTTTISEAAPTTEGTTDTATPSPDTTAGEILTEVADEVLSWGVSESSWACIETGLIEGGYVEGLDDLGFFDLFLLDEDAPLTEMPPELEHFLEGFLIFLYDPVQGCLSPAELTVAGEFFAANPEGPMTYGSEPTLDMLYDGCQAGSLADCDMLYLISEFGSEYEDLAITCGGRSEPIFAEETNCMFTEQDFTEVDDLIAQCESGFYTACDALFVVSVIGSPEEDIAISCGGIRDAGDTAFCNLVYGFGSR